MLITACCDICFLVLILILVLTSLKRQCRCQIGNVPVKCGEEITCLTDDPNEPRRGDDDRRFVRTSCHKNWLLTNRSNRTIRVPLTL